MDKQVDKSEIVANILDDELTNSILQYLSIKQTRVTDKDLIASSDSSISLIL